MTLKVACIGEAMIELSEQGGGASIGVAGDTLNTAIYLKRQAPGVQVDYVTALGIDAFSDRIAGFIEAQGVGTQTIARDANGTPGLYAITLTDEGERSFTYWRSASAARGLFGDYDFSVLGGYDLVYLSGISLAILPGSVRAALLDYLAASPAKLAFDSNYRPKLWEDQATAQACCAAYAAQADILLPSIDDEMELHGEDAGTVAARCAQIAKDGALKRGAEGPLSLGAPVSQSYAPAPRVVDTTAAGDSFNGGYLGSVLTGGAQDAALLAGHNMAAHVVQHRGAIVPV